MAVAPDDTWLPWLDELVRAGRAAIVTPGGRALAFAAEHAGAIAALYPQAPVRPSLQLPVHLASAPPTRAEAVLAIVRGHSEIAGPFTAARMAETLGLEPWEVAAAVAELEGQGLVLRCHFTPGGAGAPDDVEACDRRLLARIHRYTLDRLRAAIEPVSAQDLMRYLFDRHHLTARARVGGRAALADAIGMLQGFEVGAASWETDVLGPRVAGYRAAWLDELCLAGEVAWARLSPRRSTPSSSGSTSRATPITLARRRDLGWLLEAVRGSADLEVPTLDAPAAALRALRSRGALFFDDLTMRANVPERELAEALWDLVGRGLVASDGFQPLRDLMASGRALRRRRRVTQGRWSLVEAGRPSLASLDADDDAPPDAASDEGELADRVAGQLLSRYGIVFREIVARESFVVPWRDVLRALRRREARGDVRGGRFVAGFVGEQYALPDVVDGLRRTRLQSREDEVVRIRAADPLNLVGIVLPGPRVPSHQGAWLAFHAGAFAAAEGPNEVVGAAKARRSA